MRGSIVLATTTLLVGAFASEVRPGRASASPAGAAPRLAASAPPRGRPADPSSECRTGEESADRPGRPGRIYRGQASYYHDSFAGRRTASGEVYDPRARTAAHRSLPFGTTVRVRNLRNDRTVEVRINDRGPFRRRSRIIDLSRSAAEELDMIEAGVVPVEVLVLTVPDEE